VGKETIGVDAERKEQTMSLAEKPAYPAVWSGSAGENYEPGLTFRERLIIAAVQGLCASNPGFVHWTHLEIAEHSIIHADAVIAALEKEKSK
jgi:hypothetical protein